MGFRIASRNGFSSKRPNKGSFSSGDTTKRLFNSGYYNYNKITSYTGSTLYTTPGTYTWICPPSVFEVSVVCVGGGGSGSGTSGTVSYFISSTIVAGNGGGSAVGGTYVGDGGGAGGTGSGGGGGAGGYSGNGGVGGVNGSGGGGAGGTSSGGGGGTGLYGIGSNGVTSSSGGGGSGGRRGSSSYTGSFIGVLCGGPGGFPGGGGGGVGAGGGLGWKNNIAVVPGQSYTVVVGAGGQPSQQIAGNYYFQGAGASGSVRIVYGLARSFPSTNLTAQNETILPATGPTGGAFFIDPGTYTWKCPTYVTSVHVCCIGAGRAGGGASVLGGTESSFDTLVVARGGNLVATNVGSGGLGGGAVNGGGGAGGYTGNGGSGGGVGGAGSGGGGGGGAGSAQGGVGAAGGGVGIFGPGANGAGGAQPAPILFTPIAYPADPGLSGSNGIDNDSTVYYRAGSNLTGGIGGTFGGGGGSNASSGSGGSGGSLRYVNNIPVTPGQTYTVTVGNGGSGSNPGGSGAVRILWGAGRAWPSTNISTPLYEGFHETNN